MRCGRRLKRLTKQPKKEASANRSISIRQVTDSITSGIKELWRMKYGWVAFVAAGSLVLILILCIIAGHISGSSAVTANISYEISDAILCVYETEDNSSGYAFDAYVEVTNTGKNNIYIKDAQFLVQDSSGNRIMIDKNLSMYPAVIRPGEKGYIYTSSARS